MRFYGGYRPSVFGGEAPASGPVMHSVLVAARKPPA